MSPDWWFLVVGAAVLILFIILNVIVRSFRHYRSVARNQFAAYLAERHPGVRVLRSTPRSILLRTPTGREDFLLFDQLYPHVNFEDKEAKEAAFERFATSMGNLEGPLDLDPDRDRAHVFARIVRHDFLSELTTSPEAPPFPSMSLGIGNLSVVFVLENDSRFSYLNEKSLGQLSLSLSEALQLAKQNLSRGFTDDAVRRVLEEGAASVLKTYDGYDAARLLLVPDRLQEGERLVAMIPDRDTLGLAPFPADHGWTPLRDIASSAGGEPLWREPIVVAEDGLTEPDPEERGSSSGAG